MRSLTTALGAALLLALLPRAASAQGGTSVAEGATLYGQQCVRCHTARPSTERTDRQWLTVVNHMRARANLTRSQARALVAFLQASNASEGSSPGEVRSEDAGEADEAQAGADGRGPLVVLDRGGWQLAPEVRELVASYFRRVNEP